MNIFQVIFILVNCVLGIPDADAKSKPSATPEPDANPDPSPTPEADPKATPTPSPNSEASIFHHDSLLSITPIPPLVHPPIFRSVSYLTPANNKIPHHSIFPHDIDPADFLDPKLSFPLGPPPPLSHLSSLGPLGPLSPHSFKTIDPLAPLTPHEPHLPHISGQPKHCQYPKVPTCASNTTQPWCIVDYDYPAHEIAAVIHQHRLGVLALYADVADLSTENSVVRPLALHEETYICPSEVSYVRPRRAVNTKGHWRTIVNNVKVGYDLFTQTARIEQCLSYGKSCPLVPPCYNSKCVQKSSYQRFLVYDSCDPVFPFSIESFKLPTACSCVLGKFFLRY